MDTITTNELSADELATLCICAERYSMGRRTYMPSLVCSIIAKVIPTMHKRDLVVLKRDIENEKEEVLQTDGADGLYWQQLLSIINKRMENYVE